MAEDIVISAIPAFAGELEVQVRGTRTSGITSVTVNGATASLSPGAWSRIVILSSGANIIDVIGTHATGTVTKSLRIAVPSPDVRLMNAWNVFDEWGILLGTPRILGERNRSYELRLRHVGYNRPASDIHALILAASRELGLQPYQDAVSVFTAVDAFNNQNGTNILINIGSRDFRFTADEMRHSFSAHIDKGTGLVLFPVDKPLYKKESIKVALLDGTVISSRDYWYDTYQDGLYFRGNLGDWCTIEYQYDTRITTHDKTLGELETAIEAVEVVAGSPYLDVTVNYSTSLPASKLLPLSETLLLYGETLYLEWAPLSLKELWEKDFRELWYVDDHAYNTKLDSWKSRLSTDAKLGWGSCVLDVSSWEDRGFVASMPHLTDAAVATWHNAVGNTLYDSSLAFWLGQKELFGTPMVFQGPLSWGLANPNVGGLKVLDIVATAE